MGASCVGRQRGERRAGGNVVHVEVAPGMVTVVAAWMLDAAACADLEIGVPRVAVPALADLHRFLIALGFRTDSQGDSTVALRNSDEINTAEPAATTGPDDNAAGHKNLWGMTMVEREAAVGALGRLLPEAAGISAGESRDG